MEGNNMMKNILIIDDNNDILDMFKQLLVDEGFSVSTTKSGITGIGLFRKERFDLVITDIHMPEISGLDVVENISNDIMKVPIILMSSDYLPVDPDDVKKLGVNAIISKTINDYDFCELIKHCLEDKVYESKIF
jgi:CheY-like chemotaxis protein